MATIKDVYDDARGCGYRKPGGFYLRTDGINAFECGMMPIPLHICPTCGHGIKQTRGYNWIKGALITDAPCENTRCDGCPFSVMVQPEDDLVLIWIGKQFYHTVEAFMDEARFMGISRRLNGMPRGFEINETKVALAHPNAIQERTPDGEVEFTAGIFYIFTPDRVEYAVDDEKDKPEKLERLAEKGIDLVRVHRKQINEKLIV